MTLKRDKPLPKPHTLVNMTPKEIVARFTDAIEKFEPIDGQPSDKVVAPPLLQILYDKTGGTYNLIGLVRLVAAYTTRYGEEFSTPTQVGAYNATIDGDATAVVHARMEAGNKSKHADCGTYESAQRESAHFILAIVRDTC